MVESRTTAITPTHRRANEHLVSPAGLSKSRAFKESGPLSGGDTLEAAQSEVQPPTAQLVISRARIGSCSECRTPSATLHALGAEGRGALHHASTASAHPWASALDVTVRLLSAEPSGSESTVSVHEVPHVTRHDHFMRVAGN
jgi:hypothetical protein